MLLRFAEAHCGKSIADVGDSPIWTPQLVLAFLDDLEAGGKHGAHPQRAARRDPCLRALRRSCKNPRHCQGCSGFLAIPAKRFDRPVVGFLSREEIEAVLQAPDGRTWSGQRDRALFTVMYNTGARVSEMVTLRVRTWKTSAARPSVSTAKAARSGWCRCGAGRRS